MKMELDEEKRQRAEELRYGRFPTVSLASALVHSPGFQSSKHRIGRIGEKCGLLIRVDLPVPVQIDLPIVLVNKKLSPQTEKT